MAIIGKFYDENSRTDKVWYESSNVVYSKFIENENDNNGQLYVTFKNGATYHYKDVDMVTDYVLFKSGGIDNSQGKTLNKQIKGKYEYERVSDENINLLMEELNALQTKKEEEEKNADDNHNSEKDAKIQEYLYAIYSASRFLIEDLTTAINKGLDLGEAKNAYTELKAIFDNFDDEDF